MSRKYNEKILQGSGYSNIKFQCDYGLAILKKMGWTEGKGLGATESGRQECVQVKRRDDGLGLGTETGEFKWNNNWWEAKFNTAIKGLTMVNSATESESEEEEDKPAPPKVKRSKAAEIKLTRNKRSQQTTEDSSENSEKEEKLEKKSKKIKKEEKEVVKASDLKKKSKI
jgi:Pin2-interacting protein X1